MRCDYLNPFQPYPERQLDANGEERSAIENNMSRAVLSVFFHAENRALALASIMREIATPALRALTQTIQQDNPQVDVFYQVRPSDEVIKAAPQVLMIGISSSHRTEWTHGSRTVPTKQYPDAWIHVHGKALLVFECKNDEHPLDATQMSAYGHALKLFGESSMVPCADVGLYLNKEQARMVQDAYRDQVADLKWSAVIKALRQVKAAGEIGTWLATKAADYLECHVRPPYEGPQTVLDWLAGPKDDDRREHLRHMLRELERDVASGAKERPNAIRFKPKDIVGNEGSSQPELDLPIGAGAEAYVTLCQNGKPISVPWLQGKEAPLVLWFQCDADESKRVGVEYYLQAKGGQPNQRKGVDPGEAWKKARKNHGIHEETFFKEITAWLANASPKAMIEVTTVGFRGRSRSWQGSGRTVPEGPQSPPVPPLEALTFLVDNRAAMWRFPSYGLGADFGTIEEAATHVRKPALSLVLPVDVPKFLACGNDPGKVQEFLQELVADALRIAKIQQ